MSVQKDDLFAMREREIKKRIPQVITTPVKARDLELEQTARKARKEKKQLVSASTRLQLQRPL